MQTIRILVADDDTSFRQHLKAFLEAEADMLVIGEANDGAEAIAKATQLAPDVVLMDVRMEGLNGLEATRLLKGTLPALCVVVLSRYDLQEYREAALASGASSYVVKRALFTDLLPAIHAAVCAQATEGWPAGEPA